MSDTNIVVPRGNLLFSTTPPLVSSNVIEVPSGNLKLSTTRPTARLTIVLVPQGNLTFSTTAPIVTIDNPDTRVYVLPLAETVQELAPGNIVHLYELDLKPIGVDTVYRWCPTSQAGVDVIFNGNTYVQEEIEIEGFEWDGRGTLPEPILRLTNVNRFAGQIASANQDLVGALIKRIRTYEQFLDGEPSADPTAFMPVDVFEIFQKIKQNPVLIEWSLRALIDATGSFLPKRLCLKNHCTHTYRIWDGSDFEYAGVTCPYIGDNKFESDGTPTAVGADDDCGRDLGGCRLRFVNDPLPTRAFPGMLRVRI